MATSGQSEVTINVRLHQNGDGSSTTNQAPEPTSDSPSMTGTSPEVSATSTHTDLPAESVESYAGSPVIEIGEPEDILDDDLDLLDDEAFRAALFDRFPFAAKHGCRDAAKSIAMSLDEGSAIASPVFRDISAWIDLHLNNTLEVSSQWARVYMDEREFWDELAMVFSRLIARRTPCGAPNPQVPYDDYSMGELLRAFTRLCVRLVVVDLEALMERTGRDAAIRPRLMCTKYLKTLEMLFRPSLDLPIWAVLSKSFRMEVHDILAMIMQEFLSIGGVQELTRLSTFLLMHISAWSHLGYELMYAARITSHVTQFTDELLPEGELPSRTWKRLPQDAFRFFLVIDKPLQENVSKQTLSLNVDLCKELIRLMYHMLWYFTKLDPQLSTALSGKHLSLEAIKESGELPPLISNAWKVALLKKYIAKGRMELRVLGIELMHTHLVDIWTTFCRPDPVVGPHHPLVQYLATFLLEEQLVNYIVGVDSHPQLIGRSGNIVGFLAITGTYTHAETDTIWATIAKSPDPRIVKATLAMLDDVTKLMAVEELTYLCEKFSEMPLQAFTADLLTFGRRLLDVLRQKLGHRTRDLGMTPYQLCVRLYQEATAKRGRSDCRHVIEFADQELAILASLVGNDGNRRALYHECAKDVESMTAKATGSILAIYGLLKCNKEDYKYLNEQLDLSKLLIKEMCVFIDTERDDLCEERPSLGVSARLELLTLLIYLDPESIPQDLENALWEHLVGGAAVNDVARDMAWYKLSELARNLNGNEFVSRCFSTHLRNLEPRFFTKGLFEFVQQATQYLARNTPMELEDNQTLIIPGAAELWRIILTAPDNTIEGQAIKYLAAMHLETPQVKRASMAVVEATHVALVEQCFSQIQTASLQRQTMRSESSMRQDTLIPTIDQHMDRALEDTRFKRIIKFLAYLLNHVRTRREFNILPRSPTVSVVHTSELENFKGGPVEIRYQPYEGSKAKNAALLTVGTLDTYADLWDRLQAVTGFDKFSVIAGGSKVDLRADPTLTIEDSKIASKGQLMIIQVPVPRQQNSSSMAAAGCSVIEREILKHFDELYVAMNSEEELDEAIYHFLLMFPCQNRIQNQVASETASASELLPPGRKFQAMYSIHALSAHLQEQMRRGGLDDKFLASGVRILVTALISMPTSSPSPHVTGVDLELAVMLVDCLLRFLKERPLHATSSSYFADETPFVRRLLDILVEAQLVGAYPGSWQLVQLITQCYACIIEASLHSRRVWTAFTGMNKVLELHQNLLLFDARSEVRDRIARIIEGVCTPLPFTSEVTDQDFVPFFWNMLSQSVERCVDFPRQCGSLLSLAAFVFRANETVTNDGAVLRSCLFSWSTVLLNYRYDTPVGRDEVDEVVLGLARLILCCIQHLKSSKKPLNTGHLMDSLFTNLLFPSSTEGDLRLPVLDSQARKEVYDIVLALCGDFESYRRLLALVDDLVPVEELETNTWNIDRNRMIRTSTGYVGLKNLSNTCYMNSLLTQLFMNLDFRKFMLSVHIADEHGSQKLLAETQRLFAYMQNSYEKFANTEDFTDQIQTYENEHIDPAVQMDVDEFYNLLFDRWEGQMLTPGAKEAFRSFYGGQSITQIKSKECEHVSERLETFLTIQCEVKGKQTLEDSLKSYVEGDVMEGDNKYKCEKCGGRFVDAVKRTCLKEVHDNLIFHLKRFDFDLVTMQRSKINDHFTFPSKIDMSPYKVETLNNPDQPAKEDLFDLVGILVHTGTAESGHYYSYIRFRPGADGTPTWFEFNDIDVNFFDPRKIEDTCFGGLAEPTYIGFEKVQLPKAWNAYMLFYQRSPALQQPAIDDATQLEEVKVEVPDYIQQRIEQDNEWLIRKYCLFDPNHASFVRSLLHLLETLNRGICSDDHELERQTIHIALEHVVQVVSRLKDTLELEQLCHTIRRTVEGCPKCCAIALERLATHATAMRSLLVRSANTRVRTTVADFVCNLLSTLRASGDSSLYGIDKDDCFYGTAEHGAFPMIARKLKELLPQLGNARNAWDDFFELLCKIASFGTAEVGLLLDEGALTTCLEILVIEKDDHAKRRYQAIAKMMEKKKPPPHNTLITFLAILLSHINLRAPRVEDDVSRIQDLDAAEEMFPLNNEEYELMTFWDKKDRNLVFIQRILDLWHCGPKSAPWTPGLIIKQILQAEPEFGAFRFLATMIRETIDAYQAAYLEPVVRAAAVFCEFSPSLQEASNMIYAVVKSTASLDNLGGEAYVRFFAQVIEMVNPRLHDAKRDAYYVFCLKHVHGWGPNLLFYKDRNELDIQGETLELLRTYLFQKGWLREEGESPGTDMIRANAVRALLRKSMERVRQAWENDSSRTGVEPLMLCAFECEKWLRGLAEEDDERVVELRHPEDERLLRTYDAFSMDLRNWSAEDDDALASDNGNEDWQSDFDSDDDAP